MKQVKFFKLPEQEGEANEFLAKNPPETVSMNSSSVVINYDDGVKNDHYKALEIRETIQSQKTEIVNNTVYRKTAAHYLAKFTGLLAELNDTIISEVGGKQKYDLSKDREAKIEGFKNEIRNCEAQVENFTSKIEQAEVKIAVWSAELDKLNVA